MAQSPPAGRREREPLLARLPSNRHLPLVPALHHIIVFSRFPVVFLISLSLTVLSLVLLQCLGSDSTGGKVLFLLLGIPGIVVFLEKLGWTLWFLYNDNPDDDRYITIPLVIDIYFSFILSFAWLFMLFWAWGPQSCWDGDISGNVWRVYVRFAYLSVFVIGGGGLSTYTPKSAVCEIITGGALLSASLMNILLLSVGVSVLQQNSAIKHPKATSKAELSQNVN